MNYFIYTRHTLPVNFRTVRRCYGSKVKLLYNDTYRNNLSSRYITKDVSRLSEVEFNSIPTLTRDFVQCRTFRTSSFAFGQESSSKVEETIKNLKEEKEEKAKQSVAPVAPVASPEKQAAKYDLKSMKTWVRTIPKTVKETIIHYYHGFRLLFLDIKVSAKLVMRILRGHELNRREHRLLVKTTGDVFRLIPFSVFIIVPFMELLLPVFIKIFPGMLPSTFQTTQDKDDRMKQSLKVKLEMAKFLQKTLDEMTVQSSDNRSEKAKEFSEFFYKVRKTGALATTEEIIKFSKLFEDEITLDSLSRAQLVALCRVLDIQTLGTTNFLRFLLRMKLRSLAADDRLIDKEGVDALNRTELQQACRARGMRAYGMPEHRLRDQLSQWLDLSLNKKVPPSLLLLSRALMVPETIPMSDKLKATISALPDDIVARTKGAIGEKEGKMDHRTNIEIIKLEEKRIEEERKEQQEIEAKEKLAEKKVEVVQKPVISSAQLLEKDKEDLEVTTKDVKVLEQALDSIGKEKKQLSVEKEELKELKEEMAEYQEDVQELLQLKAEAVGEKDIEKIKVSKGANRLYAKVTKMIGKMDGVLAELEEKERKAKEQIASLSPELKDSKVEAELVRIDELIAAIKQIQNISDDHRLVRIAEILGKIDDDRDGAIKIEEVLKVIELIGKEDVKLSKKQVDELLDLMEKEEFLELEDQIQKALQKDSKDTSKSTVPATPVTKPDKPLQEEVMDDSKFTIQDNAPVLEDEPKPLKDSGEAPNVPPAAKKAEGSKQL